MAELLSRLILVYLLCTIGIEDCHGMPAQNAVEFLSLKSLEQETHSDTLDPETTLIQLGVRPDEDAIGPELLNIARDELVVPLELNPEELDGRCENGTCKFCAKKVFNFCLEASITKTGFELKISVGGHVFYDKVISVANVPLFCLKVPLVGHACLRIYDIDLKQRAACVGVQFKSFGKTINLKIKCFKLGGSEDIKSRLLYGRLPEANGTGTGTSDGRLLD